MLFFPHNGMQNKLDSTSYSSSSQPDWQPCECYVMLHTANSNIWQIYTASC